MGAGAVWHKRLRDLEVLFIHESSRLLVSSDCSGTHAAPARSSVFSAAALKWQTHSELNLTPAPRVFKVHCRRQCHGSLTVNIGNKRWLRRSMFDDSHGGVESVCVWLCEWEGDTYEPWNRISDEQPAYFTPRECKTYSVHLRWRLDVIVVFLKGSHLWQLVILQSYG